MILKADRLFAELLCTVVKAALPGSQITTVHSLSEMERVLALTSVDLIVSGVIATDGDLLDPILEWSMQECARAGVFVVTAHKEPMILNAFASAPILGVFDQTNEGLVELRRAFGQLATHGSYWSSTIRYAIGHTCRSQDSVFRQLTFTEQVMLSVIGDGCDDAAAATLLGMSDTTVTTIRRNVHRKLGIQHKGELMHFATANGFVIMTPYGIVRPGLKGMLAQRKDRFRKRHAGLTVAAQTPVPWPPVLGRVA